MGMKMRTFNIRRKDKQDRSSEEFGDMNRNLLTEWNGLRCLDIHGCTSLE